MSAPRVPVDRQYREPRLVAVYDAENAGRDDIDFHLALAGRLGAVSVTDLGCGTGVLAVELAARGHAVTGVDPAAAMLDVARRRPGGGRVQWVQGTSADLPSSGADLIVMTGHVAQVFVDEKEWAGVLRDCARALRPGGHLAFEVRNPAAAAWSGWNPADSFGRYETAAGERFESWVRVEDVHLPLVRFVGHTRFSDGVELTSTSTLAFREAGVVRAGLAAAGLPVVAGYGDWDGSPMTGISPELIILARRPEAG